MDTNILTRFLSFVIIGYFGVKIIYGSLFNVYPKKYYYRNVTINTNCSSASTSTTENIVINGFMPSLWNNELTDIITLIVLSTLIFVFTHFYDKSIISYNISPSFIILYLIGLTYPLYYNSYSNTLFYYILFSILFVVISFLALYSIYSNKESIINYLLYFITIVMLFFGLIFTRKQEQSSSHVTYINSNCSSSSTTIKNNGDKLSVTPHFLSFILLFGFIFDYSKGILKYISYALFGLLLGIFVSGISFYGLEYFLIKMPESQCTKQNIISSTEEEDTYNSSNNNSGDNNKNLTLIDSIKYLLLIVLIIFTFILVFNYMFNNKLI